MLNLGNLIANLEHSPVFVIAVIDCIFLFLLVLVFKTNCPPDLRTVIKDAFIGWNGGLAIALNVAVKKETTTTTNTTVATVTNDATDLTKS